MDLASPTASVAAMNEPNSGGRGERREGTDRREQQHQVDTHNASPGSDRGSHRGGRGRGKEGLTSSNPKHRNSENGGGKRQQKRKQNDQESKAGGSTSLTSSQSNLGIVTSTKNDNPRGQDGATGEVEAEVCFICASEIVHQSLAPCNHRTCHICSLRMRALYKSRLCPHCRTEANMVIFTDDAEKRYIDFQSIDILHVDENLGIRYERKDIEDDTILLLRYNCPDEACEVACFSWPDLHRHVRSVHNKQMCDLCTRNKKVFTHEHVLYTKEELRRHERYGDQKEDQTGFKGHPECGFCKQRFYGDDELYVHCREKHEKCHLCERTNPQRQHQYYVNYDSLEQHYRKDHFLCPDRECLEKKFIVFGSEMDLKAHQLEEHPNGLTKDARRDARRVDMSAFDYRQPVDERSERRRGGRGGARGQGARGRDPNAEPLPASSAQPLRRDEIAYQRQMAIHSAQSVSTRTFGGQLTSGEAYAARPEERDATPPATVNVPRTANAPPSEFPAVQNLSLSDAQQSTASQTPQEQARVIQHNAVIQRASQMIGNDTAKIKAFRDRVSTYKAGGLTGSQMVDALLALFDVPAVDLGKLIKELADLYDNEQRRANLLKAWNDWRAINEDYPSLPGPSGALSGTSSVNGGRRILKLKSSTAQSQRAPATQSKTWGSIANKGVSATSGPSSIGSALLANRPATGRVGGASWAGPSNISAAPTSKPAARRPAPPPTDAFPSLPAASKPNTMMAGLHRGAVPWIDNATPPINAWAATDNAGSNDGANEEPSQAMAEEGANGVGKKKGRKGKQTTLYHFG